MENYFIEEITPDKAKKILAASEAAGFKNRKVSTQHVTFLSDIIKAGKYRTVAGSTIATTDDGKLINGQHTLLAIIDSGKAVKVQRVTGVDESAFVDFDSGGRARTPAQVLEIAGEKYATEKAAAARLIHGYKTGKTLTTGRLTNDKIVSIVNEHPVMDTIAPMAKLLYSHPRIRPSVSLAVMTIASTPDENAKALEAWTEGVHNGKGLYTNDPRTALSKRAVQRIGTKSNGNEILLDFIAFVRAWNAFIGGAEMTRIRARAGDAIPRIMPATDWVG
ncbi:hypothetical protein ACPCAK_19210 [Streptomyces cellulosae]